MDSSTYTSNDPPTSIQADSLRAQLSQQKQEEAKILSEIKSLQSRLNTCRATQKQTRALLSPLRWYPQEMLSAIFEAAYDSDRWSFADRPFILASVCRRWREVVLSNSYLWRRLYVPLHTMSSTKLPFLSTLLQRSADRPILLRIETNPSYADLENSLSPARLNALKELLKHSHRLQKVCIVGAPDMVLRAILNKDFGASGLPLLEDVELSYGESNASTWDRKQWEYFRILHSAPGVRKLTLDATQFNASSLRIPGTLTELSITPMEATEFDESHCLRILEGCRKLQTCTLALTDNGGNPRPPGSVPIVLPDLHTLWLSAGFSLEDLLVSLELPALRDLTLSALPDVCTGSDDAEPMSWEPSELTGLLTRSKCIMRKFSLIRTTVEQEEVVDYLRLMPELLELVIDSDTEGYFGEILLEPLTPRNNKSAYLVPKLQVIRLRGNLSIDDSRMWNMVKLRCDLPRAGDADTSHDGAQRHLRVVDVTPADRRSDHTFQFMDARKLAKRAGLEVLGIEALYPRL